MPPQYEERAEATDARFREYTVLFKNALVYTVVLNNVEAIMEGRTGSLVLLILAFVLLATFFYEIESKVETHLPQTNIFKSLACYILGILSNLSVQFISHLVAELMKVALAPEALEWTIFAAFLTVLFVYILQRSSVGVTIPCLVPFGGE